MSTNISDLESAGNNELNLDIEYIDFQQNTDESSETINKTLIFSDNFDRPDSSEVGNGWAELLETFPENPNYIGSAVLNIQDNSLQFLLNAGGIMPARLTSTLLPTLAHDLPQDLSESGFELQYSFTPGDDERVWMTLAVADSSAGQKLVGGELVSNSYIGIEVFRSDNLISNSGVQIVTADGDGAARQILSEHRTSFQFEDTDEISVTFRMEVGGNYEISITNGVLTDTFLGVVSPFSGSLDQVLFWGGGQISYYGNQIEDLRIDDLKVFSLAPPEPLSFEFNITTAMKLSAAAYRQRAEESEFFNPSPASEDQISAYLGLSRLEDEQFRFLETHELVDVGLASGTFSDGIFTNENAAALVALAGDTLVLSFRGTNDAPGFPELPEAAAVGLSKAVFEAGSKAVGKALANGKDRVLDNFVTKKLPNLVDQVLRDEGTRDFEDWFNMAEHWGLLQPLVDAVDAFVAANDEVNKVFVTGHSLGGAMANAYMLTHPPADYPEYSSITFASPGLLPQVYDGIDAGRFYDGVIGTTIDDPRVQNIIHDEDAINFPNRLASVILGEQVVVEVRVDGDGFTGPGSQHATDLYMASATAISEAGFDTYDFAPSNALDRVELQLQQTADGIRLSDEGNDFTLFANNALRLGTSDNDILRAGGGDGQVFAGLVGDDTIISEVFVPLTLSYFDPGETKIVFRKGDGNDLIVRFNPQNDKVLLSDLEFDSAILSSTDEGAVVSWNDESLTFAGYEAGDINASWFGSFIDDPFSVA